MLDFVQHRGRLGRLLLCAILSGCAAVGQPGRLEPAPAQPPPELAPAALHNTPGGFEPPAITGIASYYGEQFRGRLTASGEVYNPDALTAAARSLPLGARIRVTNLENGRSVIVRINDRGPYVAGRAIDLSEGAARRIGLIHDGTAKVRIQEIAP